MKKFKLILIFSFLLFSVLFVAQFTGKFSSTKIIKEESIPPEVYFCPDDCLIPLVNLIKSANESIDCAFYDLSSPQVIEALENQKSRVRLVLDKHSKKFKDLEAVKNDYTHQLMHDKFCIIDNKIVLTGSFNPTEREEKEDNDVIIIHSKYLAKNYEDEFNELLNEQFGSGNEVKYSTIYLNGRKIENYFCPEDSCSEHVINVLNSADKSVYFMTFTFTHPDIAKTLIRKKGIDVKGVIERSMNNKWSQYGMLKQNGINVKLDNNKYFMHEKVFIIDNETVITGSFNPTRSADSRNDENLLIIHDEELSKQYLKQFEKVWKLAS